jgi:hypothetical protein
MDAKRANNIVHIVLKRIWNFPQETSLSKLWCPGLQQMLARQDVRAWLQRLEGACLLNLRDCQRQETERDRGSGRIRI